MSEAADWRAALRRIDPAAEAAVCGLLAATVGREDGLPRRQRELLAMVCAAMARDAEGTRRHAAEAMYCGAGDAEILQALALTAPAGGLATLAAALRALHGLLTLAAEPAAR
ncbi:MAG: hypothetical protein FJX68_18220 [Alphaproteobacteria bacterium]|nr:hypothetical protein [Alphaproteobacteria bacterium]